MATKNLKSLTFPELSNTYIVPQVDATLSIEGRPADAKEVGDKVGSLSVVNGMLCMTYKEESVNE